MTNPQENDQVDLYVENRSTGKVDFFVTLSDVYLRHYHNCEYHNGRLYVLRRIGYDGYPDEDWSDELWRYTTRGQGTRLYTGKGIDFRASPDERHIAVEGDGKLVFVDGQGRQERAFVLEQLSSREEERIWKAQIGLLKWSDDGLLFWGYLYIEGGAPLTIFRVEGDLWQVERYADVWELPIQCEYALNANTGKLAYSDYPLLLAENHYREFVDSQRLVTLFVYDLYTGSSVEIASSKAKPFFPRWLNDRTLEFDDPSGEDRAVYVLE